MKSSFVLLVVFLAFGCSGNIDQQMNRFRGDAINNGGKGVECDLGYIRSIELLDYFEANVAVPPRPQKLGEGSLKEKFDLVMKRLSRLDPERAARYVSQRNSFDSDSHFVEGPLEELPDTGDVALPENCHLKQIAIRRKAIYPGDKRYVIDGGLWKRLSNEQKVGLMLHEFAYGETSDLGQKNSVKARLYTGFLASAAFETMTADEYKEFSDNIFKREYTAVFKAGKFTFSVKAGEKVEVLLTELLLHKGLGELHWGLSHDKPKWLQIDLKTGLLTGTPSLEDIGLSKLRLFVQDGDAGAIALLEIQVEN